MNLLDIAEYSRVLLQKEFKELLSIEHVLNYFGFGGPKNLYYIKTPTDSKAICLILNDNIRFYVNNQECYVTLEFKDPNLFTKLIQETKKRFV